MEGEINNPQAKPECCHLNKVGSFVLFWKKKKTTNTSGFLHQDKLMLHRTMEWLGWEGP